MATNGTTVTGTIPGTNPKSAAARLRHLISDPSKILICPGVYDGLTARIALSHNFDCLYMTGAGTAASRLGMPDLGIASLPDMHSNASMIASLSPTVPLIADADTGYGGPIMVARTIRSYITSGIAGLHLEDQVLAKRCGHLKGKELVDLPEFEGRIKAAVMARQECRDEFGGDIVLIARTDSLQKYGLEEAIRRLKRCVELGADVAFLEGLETKEQMRRACEELKPTPVLLNMVPGGVTPDMGGEEARSLGFRIMIHPGLALSRVVESVSEAYGTLKRTGEVEVSEEAKKTGVKQIFEVCGLSRYVDFDARAGGKAYGAGV